MPRCAIFNFWVLFLENRLVTPIRSPNQRGFARNGSEKQRQIFTTSRQINAVFTNPGDQ